MKRGLQPSRGNLPTIQIHDPWPKNPARTKPETRPIHTRQLTCPPRNARRVARIRRGFSPWRKVPIPCGIARLFKPRRVEGWAFLTHPTPFILFSQLPSLSSTFLPNPMACSNDGKDAGFYPTPSASGELGEHQSLSQTSTAGEECTEVQTSTDGWDGIGQPRPMVGSPTSLRATASYGKYHCSSRLSVGG